ncbi:MAG: efflux RND transporter periplasmic adaptor subunit [Gammaproteobacteria bacterium]
MLKIILFALLAIVAVAMLILAIFGVLNILIKDRSQTLRLFKGLMIGFGAIIAVIIIIAGIKGFEVYSQIQKFAHMKQQTFVSEEAAKVEAWQPNFTAVGNLAPVSGADISNQLAGNVTAINFESGQDVSKGQLLVQLDDSSEQAQLEGLQAQEKLAELNAKRAHDIFAKHLISQSDVDTADSNLKQAKSNVANMLATIDKKAIHAPFAGHAGIRNVNPGQYLPDGTVIVTLQALDHMYANFSLPEQALPSLTVGEHVEVNVDAYPEQKFSGVINAIDSKVDPDTHNVRVQAFISNPRHLLRAGMFANVTVFAGKPVQLVTIPKAAVNYSLYGDSVFIVTPDKDAKGDDGKPVLKVKETFIKLGEEQGTRVAVTEGVKGGDMIVTSGQQKLHSGTEVSIDNSADTDQTSGADQ